MINGKTAHGVVGHPTAMSESTEYMMTTLLATNPEAWARLKGAIAILDLPRKGLRVSSIEIELDADRWQLVHAVELTSSCVVFSTGAPPNQQAWPFQWHEIPRWRQLPSVQSGRGYIEEP